MEPARKLAVYDDLFTLPTDQRAEILGGEIVTMPAPRPRHSKPQGAIRSFVGRPFDDDDGAGGPGGWWIFLEVDIRLERHEIVRPDLCGFRRERLAQPDQRPIEIAPDWVCEVLSPSTAKRDRGDKRRLYARHNIKHYWIVDPVARLIEALALRDGEWVDAGVYDDEDESARIPPFDAVEIPVSRLFLPRRRLTRLQRHSLGTLVPTRADRTCVSPDDREVVPDFTSAAIPGHTAEACAACCLAALSLPDFATALSAAQQLSIDAC